MKNIVAFPKSYNLLEQIEQEHLWSNSSTKLLGIFYNL